MPKSHGNWHPDKKGGRIEQIRAFCHTARLGTITKAAEHMGVTQKSASLQLQVLESEFGV